MGPRGVDAMAAKIKSKQLPHRLKGCRGGSGRELRRGRSGRSGVRSPRWIFCDRAQSLAAAESTASSKLTAMVFPAATSTFCSVFSSASCQRRKAIPDLPSVAKMAAPTPAGVRLPDIALTPEVAPSGAVQGMQPGQRISTRLPTASRAANPDMEDGITDNSLRVDMETFSKSDKLMGVFARLDRNGVAGDGTAPIVGLIEGDSSLGRCRA
jgi:hypothetical protein